MLHQFHGDQSLGLILASLFYTAIIIYCQSAIKDISLDSVAIIVIATRSLGDWYGLKGWGLHFIGGSLYQLGEAGQGAAAMKGIASRTFGGITRDRLAAGRNQLLLIIRPLLKEGGSCVGIHRTLTTDPRKGLIGADIQMLLLILLNEIRGRCSFLFFYRVQTALARINRCGLIAHKRIV